MRPVAGRPWCSGIKGALQDAFNVGARPAISRRVNVCQSPARLGKAPQRPQAHIYFLLLVNRFLDPEHCSFVAAKQRMPMVLVLVGLRGLLLGNLGDLLVEC